MKNKFYIAITFVAVLTMLISGAAAAQFSSAGDMPPEDRPGAGPGIPLSGLDLPEGGWDRPVQFASETEALGPEAALVTTGAPGLTFSHVQTYGVPEQAFLDDTTHFHYPYGVFARQATVWIADFGRDAGA